MCLIIMNSASYLFQLLFKLFFCNPAWSEKCLSLFLSLVCVGAHKSKADACPLRSSAQQVDSEDGVSLSLSLSRPLASRERERERVGETERWTDDSKRRRKGEKCSPRPYTSNSGRIYSLGFSYFVLFVPSKRCRCDEQGGGRDWHH